MGDQLPLQERVIANIREAERLSAMLRPLEKPETAYLHSQRAYRKQIQGPKLHCNTDGHGQCYDKVPVC